MEKAYLMLMESRIAIVICFHRSISGAEDNVSTIQRIEANEVENRFLDCDVTPW